MTKKKEGGLLGAETLINNNLFQYMTSNYWNGVHKLSDTFKLLLRIQLEQDCSTLRTLYPEVKNRK